MTIDWGTVGVTVAGSGIVSAGASWLIARSDRAFERQKWETDQKRQADDERAKRLLSALPKLRTLETELTNSGPLGIMQGSDLYDWAERVWSTSHEVHLPESFGISPLMENIHHSVLQVLFSPPDLTTARREDIADRRFEFLSEVGALCTEAEEQDYRLGDS